MSKCRNFVFTVNNYTDDHVEKLVLLKDEVDYMIVGDELGENETPHLQGFIRFRSPRSVRNIVNVLPGHVEVAKGTPYDNFIYCSKQKIMLEVGMRPKGKGKRTDLDIVRQAVSDGANADEIWEIANSYQAFRMGLEGIRLRKAKERVPPKVFWFWGPSGSGKTRTAVEMFPDAWISGGSGRWWDGYYGQRDVIIDDFREGWCSFPELLRILDRYPYRVEIKGGSVQLEAENIVITCPYPPNVVYMGNEDIRQLLRRVHIVREFGTDGTGTEVGGNSRPLPVLEFDPSLI